MTGRAPRAGGFPGTGRAVRASRILAGLTEEALASALGVAPSTVHAWEVGHRQFPASRIPEIAAACGTTCQDFGRFVDLALGSGSDEVRSGRVA